MIAAAYIRTAQPDTIAQQLQTERISSFAAAHAFQPVFTVNDSCSGNTLERPGLDELNQLAEKLLIDAVIVYKLDRLARDMSLMLHIVELLERNGVAVVSVTEDASVLPSSMKLHRLLAAQM